MDRITNFDKLNTTGYELTLGFKCAHRSTDAVQFGLPLEFRILGLRCNTNLKKKPQQHWFM